jgi:hypothetical protein
MHMERFERWFYRVADSDVSWYGFQWLRPAKTERVGPGRIVLSSIILGLPGAGAGIGLIYFILGSITPATCGVIFSAVTLVELALHVVWAHYWNKRAAALRS